MNNKSISKTFTVMEFVVLVQEIVSEYFDDNGKFQPHIGMLNEMRVFYNNCIAIEGEEPITDIATLDEVLEDMDFCAAYENTVMGYARECGGQLGLNFFKAHELAMDIVDDRKQSLTRMTDAIVMVIKKVYEMIEPFATSDNIDIVKEMSQYIKNGELDVEGIVNKYAETKRFKEVIEG